MSEPHDLRLHAEALRRHLRYSQTRRFKRQVSNGVQKGPPIGVEEGPPFQII